MTTNIKMFKLKISRKQNTTHKATKAEHERQLEGTRKVEESMRYILNQIYVAQRQR